jgi:hypothetical protein
MRTVRLKVIASVFALGGSLIVAEVSAQSPRDASGGSQCWDVLTNSSRDARRNAGKLKPSDNYDAMHQSSVDDNKVQGPGAEPKDNTGVTVGQHNSAQAKQGSSIRPAGLPNC